MRLLVIAEKKGHIESFLPVFRAKGFETKYIRILKIGLVSRHRASFIKALGENLPKCDAVFLQCRPSLAPFVEPLLEGFASRKIYCNSRLGSYYIGMNEPYKFVTLAARGAEISGLLVTGSAGSIEGISKREKYPVLVKALLGNSVQQSMVVANAKDLNFFMKSIQGKMDAFMVHEYGFGDVVTCAVIGERVFAIRRRVLPSGTAADLKKGKLYKLSDSEHDAAVAAAGVCGYDIAQVEMVNGKIFDVTAGVKWSVFGAVCSENMEEHVAQFFSEKLRSLGAGGGITEEAGFVKRIISRTVFGRFLR